MSEERNKPGPKKKYDGISRKEMHLKFIPEIAEHIEACSVSQGYQAYFDELVLRDMELKQGKVGK